MSKALSTLLFLLFTSILFAQEAPFKLYLIGDGGDMEATGETMDSLQKKLMGNPHSAVIFLGDNSYRNSLGNPIINYGFRGFDSSKHTQNKIRAQLNILNGYKGSAYFIPGNHDWWNKTKFLKGKRVLQMEESFIEKNLADNPTIANANYVFLPKNGSPGPASAELNDKKLRVIFIDTNWLILLGFKNTPAENLNYEKKFYSDLDSIMADATAKNQKIVIVAHHPVYSKGVVWEKKVKHPFLFARVKQSFGAFPSYARMSKQVNNILQKYHGVYYASGHIHALQYYKTDNTCYIVSGAGSKTNYISKKIMKKDKVCNEKECRVWNEKGFFEIDFYSGHEKVIMYHCSGKESTDMSAPTGIEDGCK